MPDITISIPNIAVAVETADAVIAIYGAHGLPLPQEADTTTVKNQKRLAIVREHLRQHLKQTLLDQRERQKRLEVVAPTDTDIT